MKQLLIFLLLPFASFGTNRYVSPSGNNGNSGTIGSPWATWDRISNPQFGNILNGGDTVFIRGGGYTSPHTSSGSDGQACYWQNIVGSSGAYVVITNYPGEHPVLDCSNVTPFYSDPSALYIRDCSYLKIIGLEVKNLKQVANGLGISRGCVINNCTFITMDLVSVHGIGGYGYNCVNSNDITYNYCDAYECADNLSKNGDGSDDSFENANGFDKTNTTSTRIIYNYCRAWLISDDGFENFLSNGTSTYNNCWAFLNGYYRNPSTGVIAVCRGNGEGFKLGPCSSNAVEQIKTRFLNNCLAFDNKSNGFNQNGADASQGWWTTLFQLYNCTAFRNGANGFEFSYYEVSPGYPQYLKNCLSYLNGGLSFHYCAGLGNVTNNSFTARSGCDWTTNLNVTSGSFQSLDTSGTKGIRGAGGALPVLKFLYPSANSILVNAGVNVGLPFYGSAPDIGAFDYLGGPLPTRMRTISHIGNIFKWQSLEEDNLAYYAIESSTDGVTWKEIGRTPALGKPSYYTLNIRP